MSISLSKRYFGAHENHWSCLANNSSTPMGYEQLGTPKGVDAPCCFSCSIGIPSTYVKSLRESFNFGGQNIWDRAGPARWLCVNVSVVNGVLVEICGGIYGRLRKVKNVYMRCWMFCLVFSWNINCRISSNMTITYGSSSTASGWMSVNRGWHVSVDRWCLT